MLRTSVLILNFRFGYSPSVSSNVGNLSNVGHNVQGRFWESALLHDYKETKDRVMTKNVFLFFP